MSPSPAAKNLSPLPSYFVVMRQFGAALEAVVDPEVSRCEVISRLVSREYDHVLFIQHVVQGAIPRDVTLELQLEASVIADRYAEAA